MSWDCKHKVGKGACKLLKIVCYPGVKGCVLHGKFEYPLRGDAVDIVKKPVKAKNVKKAAVKKMGSRIGKD